MAMHQRTRFWTSQVSIWLSHRKPLLGILLRDTSGRYYAIPQPESVRFRVSHQHRELVEALLYGADVSDAARSARD